MLPKLATLLGLLCVVGLLAYYTSRHELDDDPRLYYEIAGKVLGRGADEAYLRMKRDGTPMSAPLATPAPAAPALARPGLPYRDFAVEYPPLALGVFVVPRLFTDNVHGYLYGYQGMMAGAILGTALLLGRMLQRLRPGGVQNTFDGTPWRGLAGSGMGASKGGSGSVTPGGVTGRDGAAAALAPNRRPHVRRSLGPLEGSPYRLALWLTAVMLVLAGSYVVRRFDVLLSLTVAASIVSMLGASPFVAGLLLGAGAAAKLWPVMLLPMLVMYDRRPAAIWRLGLGFAVVPVVSHLVLYPFVGASVVSYLGFHAGRGLQLESLWSSVLMLVSKVLRVHAEVGFDHGSANLVMPRFVPAMMVVSYVVGLGAVGACYVAGYRAMRTSAGPARPRHLVEASLLLVACMVITAKVFSPQYLFWLFPLALAVADWRVGVLYMAALGMTHLYFPYRYDELMDMRWWGVGVLLVRNLMVVGLVVVVFRGLTRGYWARSGRPMLLERVGMGEE